MQIKTVTEKAAALRAGQKFVFSFRRRLQFEHLQLVTLLIGLKRRAAPGNVSVRPRGKRYVVACGAE